jgi:formylglycine-generating enzyme required for sulfatase activity
LNQFFARIYRSVGLTEWMILGAVVVVTAALLMPAVESDSVAYRRQAPGISADPVVFAQAKAPPPVANPDSVAKSEKEMKRYTEVLSGTDVTFDMVPIPGGTYLMGSPESEEGRNDDEGPQHKVTIAPFWMGKCEVTWDEYDIWSYNLDIKRREAANVAVTDRDRISDAVTRPTKPYTDMTFGKGHDGYPASCMTGLAAATYCKWLSAKTGRYYRLPTEAEWEYACRAGSTTRFFFGDDESKLGDYAWYIENSDEQYQQVGKKKPSPWGLHDIHGNVAEWCLDQYYEDGYKKHGPNNPFLIAKKEYPQIVRGGSWEATADMCRSAAREGSDPEWKVQDPQLPKSKWYHTDAQFIGFRVVRPLTEPSEEEKQKYELGWGKE